GPGNDTLDGGLGYDDVQYGFEGSPGGVFFTATDGVTQADGMGSVDTLFGIEQINISGSNSADQLTGNSGQNWIQGNGGNDTLAGGGGNDNFGYDVSQNNGIDRIMDLQAGENLNFNNFQGPAFAFNGSVLAGDDASGLTSGQVMVGSTIGGITNVYVGTNATPGSDITIELQGSYAATDFSTQNDSFGARLTYGPGQALNGTPGNDFLQGQGGADTIQGFAGDDNLFGNGGNDSLSGGDGNDFLMGGAGNDTLDGGAGTFDMAGYGFENSTGGVNFTASNGATQADGQGGIDTLIGIEQINIS